MMHKNGSQRTPIFTGLCFGLAAATRYIGVSLLLAGGILWLTEAGKSSRERIRNAFWFSAVGIMPLLLWAIRNQALTGQPTSRVFALHPISGSLWIKALNTMLLWLVPGRFVHGKELIWLGGIGLFLVIWLGVVMIRERMGLIQLWQSLYQCKPVFMICLSFLAYWVILIFGTFLTAPFQWMNACLARFS
jgi:hypothetical protein